MIDHLSKLLDDLGHNVSLFEPDQLRERIQALDRLDVFNLPGPPAIEANEAAVICRARAVQGQLEIANSDVYNAIRSEIKLGRGARAVLQWLPISDCGRGVSEFGEGYDYLDEIIAGVFQLEEPEDEMIRQSAEMVFYQPSPVRLIFDLFDRLSLTEEDVLVDLGSGLGHVPLLTCICTDARSIGVEIEPVYAQIAQRTAERLNLKRATFVEGDARVADLAEGTVFYLYTPFRGMMLRNVLDSLRREGAKREIRICTFGPCTTTVTGEDWLEAIGLPRPDRVSLFRSGKPCPF